MILELIKAVALLLALNLLQSFIVRFSRSNKAAARILSGGLFGAICVIGMMAPIEFSPGVIFDPRSVVVSAAGLFGGPVVAGIAATIGSAYRIWLGGSGMYVGVAVIVVCTLTGLAYRYGWQKGWVKVDFPGLVVFGIVVQLAQLSLFALLPADIVDKVMSTIALPLVLIFTPATVILGLLFKDLESRLQIESALVESEAKLSLHLENTPLAAITWDENFCCTQWNKAATQIFGYTADEAVGKNALQLLVPEQLHNEIHGVFDLLMEQQGGTRKVNENRTKDGRTIICEWYNTPLINEQGKAIGVVSLGEDITARKQSEELIWTQANFDPLTGLVNRRMLQNRLEQEIKSADRTGKSVALLYLDLDEFKDVNDTLGHDMGDVLLVEVAKRLKQYVREIDTVARLGGDEFTILMGGLTAPSRVERVANDVLQQMAIPFQLGDEVAYISASIGITLYPQDAADAEVMFKNADQAMYAAKNTGRNCFEYFTTSMQHEFLSRMSTIKDLRAAIPDGQFCLYYQPIVDLKSGSIYKAEALMRWQHPVRGLVGPGEFITIAEETRMIIDIGDWAFREAARQSALWRESHDANFQISVNTSPVQYQSDHFNIRDWLDHLRSLQLSGHAIAVEITEGLLMETINRVEDKLLMFRDAGIQVALDDFGTGYSSLSYLKKFDIDYLKIDRSFIQNLEYGSDEMVLCEAIIVMSHKLGLKVVAEGIETQQQCELLTSVGCDYGQGYLFSKPVPAADFEKLMLPG